jgi:dTDP-glucose pyrophosphorylase
MKKMDQVDSKLLFVFDGDAFAGILSIGDIQRAIIRGNSLDTPVLKVVREQFTAARPEDARQDICDRMLKLRTECMPVVRSDGSLEDVLFWEDVFTEVRQVTPRVQNPVVIMAGGKGTRLRPLTNVIPKPLVPVGDKTIIELIIAQFRASGVTEFFITANYKADMLKAYLEQSDALRGVSSRIIVEPTPLGTIGSLSLLKNLVRDTFFVSNCDVYVDQEHSSILEYHKSNRNLVTLVAALRHFSIPYGIVTSGVDGELATIEEKPAGAYLANTGVYVLEPQLLDRVPDNEEFTITDLIDLVRQSGGRVGVFPVTERSWLDIGEWPQYLRTVTPPDGSR